MLVVLFFLIIGRSLTGLIRFGPGALSGTSILILCLIISLLLITMGVHFYYFFLKKREGLRLQVQLVLVFIILILAASLPQSLLSLHVLEGVMQFWVGEELEATLEDSSDFVLSYYGIVSDNLYSLGRSTTLGEMLDEYIAGEEFPWKKLRELNLFIETVQIFSGEGEELYGNEDLAVERGFTTSYSNSYLPVRTSSGRVILSYIRKEKGISLVLTASLLSGTAEIGRSLEAQLDRLLGYNQFQQDSLRWKLYFFIFFVFPLLLISINLAILFARTLITPINELGQALRKVTEGDYNYRISLDEGGGVYDFYVDIFNEMIDELNSSRSELVQTEKIGAWRDIAQRLAHEIRNPLTPIKLNAQRILLKASDMDEETQKYLLTPMNRILKEVDELDLLLREFREFAGQRAPVLKKLELSRLIDEVWDSYGKKKDDVIFSLHDEEEGRVILGDSSQLKQVFRNIFSNAMEAMEFRGRLSVRLTTIIKGTSGFCRIAIRDWGRGIDEETLTRIFEPYYTTRKTGTGLGLPIVERIITDHKGRIWVESSPGEGTVFYIDLPIGRDL